MATKKKPIAKARKAAGTEPVPGRPGMTRKPPSAMIYALGDSWFKYPTLFDLPAPINLLRALDALPQPGGKKYCILDRGKAGATSEDLTTGDYFEQLARSIRQSKWDFLLLSMGGNDFVGSTEVDGKRHTRFGDYILKYSEQTSGKDLLNQVAVSAQMDKTLENYRKVFRLCEQSSANKNIQIVTHVYDFLVPDNRGARLLDRWQVSGPWMYDDLVRNNVPPELRPEVPRALLEQFAARLGALAEDLNAHTQTDVRLRIAQTQGVLTPIGDPALWINEIHPKNKGYEKLILKFDEIIAPLRDALKPAAWRVWST